MNQIPDRLKRKIEALRKMAEQSVSENEAMIAAKQLHAILSKYGITSLDVGELLSEYATESIEIDHKTAGKWAGLIAVAISKMYFCHCYQETNGKSGTLLKRYFRITGTEHNRFSAKIIAARLIAIVDAEARLTVGNRPPGEDPWAYICSFRTAAGKRIYYRCEEIVAQGKAGQLKDEDGRNLPALLSLYEQEEKGVRDYLDGKVKLVKSHQRAAMGGRGGAIAGDNFGRSVNLHHELNSKIKPMALPGK